MQSYNIPAVFALIVYPIFLIILGVKYAVDFQVGWFEVLMFVGGYYISNITVGIGFHRLWSHDSYKTNKYVEFILVLLSAGTLQGPALSWASNHFKHHRYTDTELDPHSPLKYKSKIKGFLWAHIGWMLVGEGSYKSIDKVTMVKLGKNNLLRWQLKNYWVIAGAMNTIVPALVGFLFGWSFVAAYAGFLFIGLGRALQQHITFCINSLCHFLGTQKYTTGTSGDIWWLALFFLGENWHNYHHAFPSDYRNGAKWYQLDVHKWIIYLMSLFGLAWDLKRTPENRVEAKVAQTKEIAMKIRNEQVKSMYDRANELALSIQNKLTEMDSASNKVKKKFKSSLFQIQENLTNIAQQLNVQLKGFDTSEKIISICSKELKRIEASWQKLYKELNSVVV